MSKNVISLAALVAASSADVQIQFAEMVQQDLDTLAGVIKEYKKTDAALVAQQKQIAVNRKTPIKAIGKVLAAYQARFDDELAKGSFTKTSFGDYFENATGHKLEAMGRPLQCSRVFTKFVTAKLGGVSEFDYDNVAEDWLYLVSAITGLLIEKGKWTPESPSDDMLDMVNILRIRPNKGAERLRALKNKLEGKVTMDASGKGPELDLPNAKALVERIVGGMLASSAGAVNGLLTVAEVMTATVKNAEKLDEEIARKLYFAVTGMVAEFPAELVAKFTAPATPAPTAPSPAPAKAKGKAKPQLPEKAATPDFAGWVKNAYPDMPADAVAPTAEVVAKFYAEKNAMPASAEAFDAWAAVAA